MFAKMIWWTRPPDTITSGRVETDGVPINAPRPLPRPVRAMRLRLREHSVQRKPQSAIASAVALGLANLLVDRAFRMDVAFPASRMPAGPQPRWLCHPLSQKSFKKVL